MSLLARACRNSRILGTVRGFFALVVLAAAPAAAYGDSAPFDLSGPTLRVTVTRAGKTLPISQTPNLAEGDSLSISADLPTTQSVRYLLVAGFLRGATNPSPESWFFQSQTWKPKEKAGLAITVPQGAQQLLVFLAPTTGGDFKTLVGAVRGRPGAFVRASQDLNQASLDHARLQAFLAAVRTVNQNDPGRLKAVSPLLARSLAIKLETSCLTKAADTQAACLTQGQDSLVLNDGHSTSMVHALSSGYSAELIQQLSAAPQVGGGAFSPYVGSVLDIARILDSFHTAQYQYIPALGTLSGDRLSLLLNAPPSFQNPKSVLVVALPAVEPAQPPPLHPIDPNAAECLQRPDLILPAEGAPLVFSTDYAHDLVLHVSGKAGASIDIPVRADAARGGFALDATNLDSLSLGESVDGTLMGSWGFESYTGPKFHVENARAQTWRVAPDDEQALIAGRDGVVRLRAQASGCVQGVMLQPAAGPARPVDWKTAGQDGLTVTLSLKDIPPGPAQLQVQSYGRRPPDAAPITVYAAASRLEGFIFHAGDSSGVLKGSDLGEVASLTLDGVAFSPTASGGADGGLTFLATDAAAASALKAGRSVKARVKLGDGRTIALTTVIAPSRPSVTLLAKSVQPPAADGPIAVQLGDPDELPRNGQLTFSVRTEGMTTLTGTERVEVATHQDGVLTTLTSANGGFTLQNAQIGVVMLDLGKAFGASAFGALRFRIVNLDGASDWQPLGVLVRAPVLHELSCPRSPDQPCQISGSDLFLIDSVSNDRRFDHPAQVPAGFPGNTLEVPHPIDGRLYVKLGDDPSAINVLTTPTAPAQAAAPGS